MCAEISKFQVQKDGGDQHRPAIAIVARVVDALEAHGRKHSAPSMEGVIGLDDIFAAVIQAAIAEQKSQATECQVFLVVAGDAVRDHGYTRAIEIATPARATCAQPKFKCLVIFRVGIGFVLTFVPTPAAENSN